MIGNEGMIGVALYMNGGITPNRAVVQSGGSAYRLPGHMLREKFERAGGQSHGAINHLLLRYTQALIAQMAQTAVCNRHHSVD